MAQIKSRIELFDLAFDKFYVLADDRIIFPDLHLFRHGPSVLLGDVKEPGVGRGIQFDFYRCRFGHSEGSSLVTAERPSVEGRAK